MSFISVEFVVLFVSVLLLYFALPFRLRWILLFCSSYLFYGYWNANYLILLVFSSIVDYYAGWKIATTDPANTSRRRMYLVLSIAINLGTLGIFKYFNFFNDNIAAMFGLFGIPYAISGLDVLLPVGISFYTFQSMAYTIDVYRGDAKAEKHLGRFLTFISFFPQLVAGPIERAKDLLPQFSIEHKFDTARAIEGLQLILWGAFKKMVIADRLALYVNAVYNSPRQYEGLPMLAAIYFFTIQIYCDFSGYSDIAVGTARVLGFKLSTNFRQPLNALNVRDFWTRWHITLSYWFRDYVYVPLARLLRSSVYPRFNIDKKSVFATVLPSAVVFLLIGLWHGAAWTFVAWGGSQAILVGIETWLDKRRKGKPMLLPSFARWAVNYTLIAFSVVLFRSSSLGQAAYIYQNVLNFSDGTTRLFTPFNDAVLPPMIEFWLSIALCVGLLITDYLIKQTNGEFVTVIQKLPRVPRWAVYYGLSAAIVFALFYTGLNQAFIYFQF